MSEAIVFGQQIKLFFSNDGSSLTEKICEIDSFTSKHDDIVKKNTPLGVSGVDSIDVLDDGGTCTFEAKKRNSKLLASFLAQSEHNRGGLITSGQRGKTPYLILVREIEFCDGSIETVQYKGLVIHNLEESVSSAKDEFVEKFEGTYKERRMSTSGDNADASSILGYAFTTIATQNVAKLSASNYADFQEFNVVSYSEGTSFT